MTDWFHKMPPRVATSIAPQERPPVWVSIILTGVAAVLSWVFVGCAAWWLL